MPERLFGVETEYAVSALDSRGVRERRGIALTGLMTRARRQLAHLPDDASQGVYLSNGARFYVDCGGHPEFTTPECTNPWDVVRFIHAGDAVLLRLAETGARASGRTVLFRTNVDYSGSGATWGSHESYMHSIRPGVLPAQLIPHFVSRIVYTGAGGFRNDAPGVEFTLSPRAAHIAREVSSDSTTNRGIFHDKDEALAAKGYHRLHVICGESVCSETAGWLRVGCTALVVALCEAGVLPGADVALKRPVEAMRVFAADPTCTATVETKKGPRLTAVAIQRHYLAAVEAHAHLDGMPPWTADVCRRWRAVLDDLDGGGLRAATTLDWAIKLGLYRHHVHRHGMTWDSLAAWTAVVRKLSAACARATKGQLKLTAEVALGPGSPIADDVKALTPAIREAGLHWGQLGIFLALRDELFEIDTRFAQLGRDGIFNRLDAAGVLTHRVPGVDRITHAIDHPPEGSRARLRGALVRELWRHGDRYSCDWQAVRDREEGRYVDLSDPFQTTYEWKESAFKRRADIDERLLARSHRRRWHGDDTAFERRLDPVELNQTALTCRRLGHLDEAERLLRRAIAIEDTRVPPDSPKRPHRRNNLAIVLLRAGQLAEAGELNAEAWRLKAGRHDLTSGRILFVRTALALLAGDRDVGCYLGQLKTLLCRDALPCDGDIAPRWEVPDVLTMLTERLDAADAALLADVAETLNDPARRATLERRPAWHAAAPVALDIAWPQPRPVPTPPHPR